MSTGVPSTPPPTLSKRGFSVFNDAAFSAASLTPRQTHLKAEFDPRSPGRPRSPVNFPLYISTPEKTGGGAGGLDDSFNSTSMGTPSESVVLIDPRSPGGRATPPTLLVAARSSAARSNRPYVRSPLGGDASVVSGQGRTAVSGGTGAGGGNAAAVKLGLTFTQESLDAARASAHLSSSSHSTSTTTTTSSSSVAATIGGGGEGGGGGSSSSSASSSSSSSSTTTTELSGYSPALQVTVGSGTQGSERGGGGSGGRGENDDSETFATSASAPEASKKKSKTYAWTNLRAHLNAILYGEEGAPPPSQTPPSS